MRIFKIFIILILLFTITIQIPEEVENYVKLISEVLEKLINVARKLFYLLLDLLKLFGISDVSNAFNSTLPIS
jgi:nucleoside recognition membrane protein YjiH